MITIVSRHGISSITPKWLAARRLAVLHNTARSATRVRPLLLLPYRTSMLIQRTGDVEACPSGHLSCSSVNIAVAGGTDSDPLSTTPDAPVANTTYYSRPGVHRFIGIGMVIALAVVAFALWVYFAKYPRRKLAEMGFCVRRAKAGAAPKAGEAGDAALKGAPDDAEAQRTARDEKEKEKARNLMLQAEPRGVIKEVSGGVVMYTEAPRPRASPTPRPVAHRRMGIRARPRRSLRGELFFFFW